MRSSFQRLACGLAAASVIACGSDTSARTTPAAGADPTTSAAATPAPSRPAAPAAVPGAAAPAASSPAVRVSVGRTPQLGPFLTDGRGRALYLLEEDRAGESTCYEMCAAIWPPVLAGTSAPVAADSAVRAGLLGSTPRRGGGAQVTYNGHPLYYYLGDAAPGQTRGQHVEDSWGEWYLVSPSGRHVRDDERSGRRRRGGRDRGGDDDR